MTAVLSTAQDAFFDVLKTVPLLLLVYARSIISKTG